MFKFYKAAMATFNFKAILPRWTAKKDEGALQKRSDFCTSCQLIQRMSDRMALRSNVRAFVFVAEFEIRLPGTNADVKYKSSFLFLWLNL